MPECFGFPVVSEIWQPLAALEPATKTDRQARVLNGFGRLREGVALDQAYADLQAVISSLARAHPETNGNISPRVDVFRSGIGGPIVPLVAALTGAVAFVLLIACANVANLLLARAASRAHEMSVRMSIGASRWRIVRQLLIESLVLAACAGALGLALSTAAIQVFSLLAAETHPPYWMKFSVDWPVFACLATICLGTSVLFGLVPAIYTARTDVVAAVTRGVTGGRRGRRWSSALVVGQLALTLVLLSGAGAMMRNLIALSVSDPGVDTASLARLRLDLPSPAYGAPEQRLAFYRRLDERLATMPGLRASIASVTPAGGGALRQLSFDGRPDPEARVRPIATMVTIGDRYFETIARPLIRGRLFAAGDGEEGRGAAVVNERFVAMHFGNRTAIGQRIRLASPGRSASGAGSAGDWMTIVGVVPNVQQRPADRGFDPVVYVPLAAEPAAAVNILVRGSSPLGLMSSQVQEQLRAVDPDIPVFDVRTIDDLLAYQRWPERIFGSMFAIFAAAALTLATIGLYAVTAYAVSERTREIGLRIALGAGARHVWWLATRRASIQLAIALVLGLTGSVAVLQVVPRQITHADGDSSGTIAVVTLLLVLTAFVACLIPARRALAVDPVQTLKEG
jgi:putative ABC transport system permease protein